PLAPLQQCWAPNSSTQSPAGTFSTRSELKTSRSLELLVHHRRADYVHRQYIVGEPITCFIPSQVSGSTFEDYMENICWVQGTYPLPVDSQFSNTEEFWKSLASKKLMYYQWVPFILGLQTMLFYLPLRRWWRAPRGRHLRWEDREKIVHQTAVDLEQLLLLAKRCAGALFATIRAESRCFEQTTRCGQASELRTHNWLPVFVKLLYLANGIGQLYLMQTFLRLGASNHSSVLYGAEILSNIAAGRDWRPPWRNAEVHRPVRAAAVNMLNEKIYIFLWFWMAIGLLITALPAWLLRVASCRGRSRYVRRHLQLRQEGLADKRLVGEFVDRFLRHDGVFLLKMMQMNVGDLVTGDVTLHLYRLWLRKHRERLGSFDEELVNSHCISMVLRLSLPPGYCQRSTQGTGYSHQAADEDADSAHDERNVE
uniref:Innexin n=1 Tax=Macrostomum lignano TaxID=282301 RepID=A0A1I8FJ83_9PLAT